MTDESIRRDPLFDLVPFPCDVAVEVGTQRGQWSRRFLHHFMRARLYTIDPWPDSDHCLVPSWGDGERNMRIAKRALAPYLDRVMFIRGTSIEAAAVVPNEIDFCFLDGSHEPDDVYRDLSTWWPRLRPGGLLAGDDWGGAWSDRVRAGVRRYFGEDAVSHAPLILKRNGRLIEAFYVFREAA